MNFSDTKTSELTKKCVARAFKVNCDNTDVLAVQVSNNTNFQKGMIISVNTGKYIKLKEFITKNGVHFLYFSIFNKKEQISITPSKEELKDLVEIENMDNLHAFMLIKENKIATIMQISSNWCEAKIAHIFEQFGITITPSAMLRNDVIAKIKRDGFRALHVNVSVDESDFVTPPGYLQSLIKKEPAIKAKGITGHLTIDAKGNAALAQSVENNTALWVDELDPDFYFETKKHEMIKGDDLKIVKTYYTFPYGSKSISARYAKEILEDFTAKEL
ncbi:hypothetical protein ACFMH7_004820 [Escherichia coli O8:H49]